MSKISCMSMFFVLHYTFFLCGAEQQILVLHKDIPLPDQITSICFNKALSLIAYTAEAGGHQKTSVNLYDIETDVCLVRAKVDCCPQSLCLDDVTNNNAGMLTQDGKVVLFDWPNRQIYSWPSKDKKYSALSFNKGHCYAGTSIGELFKLQQGQPAELVCHMPHGYYGRGFVDKHPKACSIAFNESSNRIGLTGLDVMKDGTVSVFDENKNVIYSGGAGGAPVMSSCFDSSGRLYAHIGEKCIIISDLTDAHIIVNPNFHTKYFKYESPVTQLCFDGTSERLFVGLENGEVYLSKLKNAAHREHPENHSTLLLQWGNPIQALSFNVGKSMLGVATLYKAALFRYCAGK